MKQLILFLAFCLFSSIGYSQDTIILKNGDELNVKITELDDGTVKFYYADDPEKIIVTMNRSLIREIKFQYGRVEKEITPGAEEAYYVDDKKNNLLINFTSIASKNAIIGLEHSLSPTSSISGYLKFPGVGADTGYYESKNGFGVEVDYKVKAGSVFKKNQYRPQHLLQGFYLRPDLGFTTAKFENEPGSYNQSEKYTYIYGGFDIGNQWVFNNSLSLDIYTGLNFYGGDYEYVSNNEVSKEYSEIRAGNLAGSNGVGIRYGIQLGFLFN